MEQRFKLPTHLLLIALAAFVILAGGCSSMPILISTEQEIAMGEEAAPQFEAEFGGRVPSSTLQSYVQSVGRRVSDVSDREMPYDFVLVAADVPNAFALPGGKIFITAGLMSLMSNERQLAAVLGHETAHVAKRHNVRLIQQQMGAAVLVEIAGTIAGEYAGTAEAATQVVTSMVNLRYSRDNEFEADEAGILYMARAGYNPWGMNELLTILMELHEREPSQLEEMFLTHPLTSKRLEEARIMISANPEYATHAPDQPDPHAQDFIRMRKLLLTTLPASTQ
ncbi:MAG: M48 family metalloprotease [Planctomycetota bacterium]|jgi:predicted Zn-dependent protease